MLEGTAHLRSARRPGPPPSPVGAAALAAALTALVAPLVGCGAVAVGGLGILVSQEFVDNAHVVHYDQDVDEIWAHVRTAVGSIADEGVPVIDDTARTAELQVQGGRAAVRVEATGPRRSRMLVGARKFGVHNASLAHYVMVRIDSAFDEMRTSEAGSPVRAQGPARPE